MATISVIVPVFKVEKYLDKCVESILNQSFVDLELILIDDGSPDRCPKMCDLWKKKDSRVKVIHKSNGGLSDARNAGIKAASGKYISFVDSDDWVQPEFLNTLYTVMHEKQADIVECGVMYVDELGLHSKERKCEKKQLELTRIEALERLILEKGVYQTVWNKLYKRDMIKDINFEIGKYHEDDFWTYQILERCKKIVVIENVMYMYLQRKSSIMGNGYSFKRLDGLEAHLRRKEYLKNYESLYLLCKEQLWYDCMYHLQCTHKWLSGNEKSFAIEFITKQIEDLNIEDLSEANINFKYKIWFILFKRFPNTIVKIRNILGIGTN